MGSAIAEVVTGRTSNDVSALLQKEREIETHLDDLFRENGCKKVHPDKIEEEIEELPSQSIVCAIPPNVILSEGCFPADPHWNAAKVSQSSKGSSSSSPVVSQRDARPKVPRTSPTSPQLGTSSPNGTPLKRKPPSTNASVHRATTQPSPSSLTRTGKSTSPRSSPTGRSTSPQCRPSQVPRSSTPLEPLLVPRSPNRASGSPERKLRNHGFAF